MDMLKRLRDNYEARDNSFLYYLHEENLYHEVAFSELCDCISSLCLTHPYDKVVSSQIIFIYGQALRHFIYHFDPNDLSRISNFPCDYSEKLEFLECIIMKYFNFNPQLSE